MVNRSPGRAWPPPPPYPAASGDTGPTKPLDLSLDLPRALAMQTTKLEQLRQDQELLRQFELGPYEYLDIVPGRVDLVQRLAPANLVVNAGSNVALVPPINGPGAVLFFSVLCSLPTYQIAFYFEDSQAYVFDFTKAMVLQQNAPLGLLAGAVSVVDFANQRHGAVFSTLEAKANFASKFRIDITNNGTAALTLIDYHLQIKRVGAQEKWLPQLIAGAPQKVS